MDSVLPAVRPAAGAAVLASCGSAPTVTLHHQGTVILKACAGGLSGEGTSASQAPVCCAQFPMNVVRYRPAETFLVCVNGAPSCRTDMLTACDLHGPPGSQGRSQQDFCLPCVQFEDRGFWEVAPEAALSGELGEGSPETPPPVQSSLGRVGDSRAPHRAVPGGTGLCLLSDATVPDR